jgi:alkanesulfonate monooxygenase SsuD/methylene tetrahydromethanopterin reductase-like flavin-dependent oxidoreductase (luciferase family)
MSSTSSPALEFGTTNFCPVFHGAEVASANEALGYDMQLFGENHNMAADIFGELRDAARATTRIKLLAGPVNFVTRDPGVVASAIAPLQILSAGRAVCGIARGDSAVALAGRKPQRHDDMARDLDLIRSYLHRETVNFGDRESRLEWIGSLAYTPVPIEMVCSGPRAIALAATKADRIGLSVGGNPERVRWALAIIDAALDAAGRTRDDVRIGAYLPIAVTDTRAEGRTQIRYRVPGWAHMSSFHGNDLSSQPEIMRNVTARLREGYDYRYHRADVPLDNPNTRQIDEEFGDWFGIGGPPTYVAERLHELVELGVTAFVSALGGEEHSRFAADVIPVVRRLAG